ncbi:hypothetical protein SLEP1_g45769 [Rubroshorea leprosula]|uniref:Uncharacterized protein n=1 Tax=Rubroshorea leprosula TaxID=152421 RepID=A0AAV5LKD3_9ROSI|nr:hypothetical protein SLEP1_g45769 [Rubroshorea leprosula]
MCCVQAAKCSNVSLSRIIVMVRSYHSELAVLVLHKAACSWTS